MTPKVLVLVLDAEWKGILIRGLEGQHGVSVLASVEDKPQVNPDDIARKVREFRPHCAVINWGWGVRFGAPILRVLRETAPHLPVAVLSGLSPEQLEGVGADQVYWKGDGLEAVAGIANFARHSFHNPRREPADVKPAAQQ